MTNFRKVSPVFAVAPQIAIDDLEAAHAQGYTTIICNRPDRESPDQPNMAEMEAAAHRLGLAFIAIPFAGPPQSTEVLATRDVLASGAGPILAYCRTGTRSITVWALASAANGQHDAQEIIGAAAAAGYDLSHLNDVLRSMSPH